MNTNQSNCTITNSVVNNAELWSIQEYTHQTSSLTELLEYALSLKARVDSLLKTEEKCSESSETIQRKISDFFSNEISQLEKALLHDTVGGV